MYRYSVPCNPRITLAAFLAHFFLQDYREGATPFAPAGRFQSTCPRRGTTIPESKLEDSDDWFQSTLPRGERRRSGRTIFRPGYVSIHAPTRGATAISPKNPLYFQLKLTFFLSYKLIFFLSLFCIQKSLYFVCIFWCESPDIFMSASYSHSHFIIESMYHLQEFLGQHPYVLPLSDTYSLNNRISNYPHSHQ